jgi:hypothetical protein
VRLLNHGQPAPYPSLAVRARNGRVADKPRLKTSFNRLRLSQCTDHIAEKSTRRSTGYQCDESVTVVDSGNELGYVWH